MQPQRGGCPKLAQARSASSVYGGALGCAGLQSSVSPHGKIQYRIPDGGEYLTKDRRQTVIVSLAHSEECCLVVGLCRYISGYCNQGEVCRQHAFGAILLCGYNGSDSR